jgi:hypothetical protein
VFADGLVHAIKYPTTAAVVLALITANGGEVVADF